MRVFLRRGAAMSPRKKHIFLLFAFLLLSGTFYCFPFLFYVTLILAVCCVVCFYKSGEPFPARLGLNPRAWQNVPTVLRRWLSGLGGTGVSVGIRGKTKHGGNNRAQLRESEGFSGHSGWNRREPLSSDSFLCSPRDFLMGSYIGKPGSPAADTGRPRPGRNPREQLRERLCRPNYAVQTPIRRLSFTGEPLGTFSRFTITPQRHYPLQQPGVPSVGVLPPVRWDGFTKKNVLNPLNSPPSLRPVTVKIARPNHNTTSLSHFSSPVLSRAATADPCSRESVLRVLESRKRDVEDEDRSFSAEHKSKRRRNESGGSSHSAFEPMLPNGTPSQLVPKPGNLKRVISSLAEESIMKRSRTSSISSGSGHAQRGSPGCRRNAIQSSYSSSLGISQRKKRSAPSSPLSSPGSSRCQTPEGLPKRPREDDGPSPSSAASVRSDQASSEKALDTSKLTPIPKLPVISTTDSTGSGGKRKRKIQLVSRNRDDHISLPPPPELGYTITVKDLDEEKKAGISKIQKILETPAPEPEKSFSPQPSTSTQPASTSTVTLSSLLAAPLPTPSSSVIPVINLDPSPGGSSSGSSTATTTTTTTPKAPKSLLEALKMNISSPAGSVVPAASITTVPATSTPSQPSTTMLSPLPSVTASLLPPASQPSSFAQGLSQVTKAPIGSTTVAGSGLFGLTSQFSTVSSAPNPVTTASVPSPGTMVTSSSSSSSSFVSGSSTNPLLASEFKPIFTVNTSATTPSTDTKHEVQSFKPIFGEVSSSPAFGQASSITNTTSAVSSVSLSTTMSVFGGLTSSKTVPPPAYPGLTTTSTPSTGSITSIQPAVQPAATSLFGNWSTPSSTSTATAQAQNTGSTFQFGAGPSTAAAPASTAVSTIPTQAPFSFGATKPEPQAATQKVFAFGQAASTHNTTTPSFGGFAMSNAASTTAATTTQSTFAFGKSTFEPPSAPSTFSSSAAAPKPFPFGGEASSSTPASNSAPTPFPFGAPAAISASTFSTPVKPTFGTNTTGFAFGSTTVPSAASPAPPSFGATQTQNAAPAPTFAFGSAGTQPTPAAPAQPATGGFNFSAGLPCPQFGTPLSNNSAPQMDSFNFGAAASDKPTFGTPTPSFGQCTAVGPIPFGSPGTPAQGFNAVPFGGSPAAPSFSIGAGSRPPGARQRLQARRTRKK
ncbi:nuclear envelope pore membrane protein POM 121 [Gouania willdenowi]|uniref:Nuclear envelope pore membrane protein POM 121-like n=1 Tax=Gouania willdenowi TaxID=441366 RepID=A0A8C5EPK9_GOUWI|nr:nuclear envelope pore membrane protein POM 121-like [Gouania willdenowi]